MPVLPVREIAPGSAMIVEGKRRKLLAMSVQDGRNGRPTKLVCGPAPLHKTAAAVTLVLDGPEEVTAHPADRFEVELPAVRAIDLLSGLQSYPAKAFFIAHQVAGRLGAGEALRKPLRRGVRGLYRSSLMTIDVRPSTWDLWTASPAHERETSDWIEREFRSGIMVDVGAYCGTFALRHRRAFDHVVAFEASSANFKALVRNVALSNTGGRIMTVNAAATDRDGVETLYLSTEDTNSLVGSGRSESVRAVRLDDFFANGETIALLKIDVEGAEPKVLRGAERILTAGTTVLLEANGDAALREIESVLHPLGYRQLRQMDGRNFVFARG